MGFWKDAGTALLASAYVTGKAGVAAAKLSGRAVGSAGRFVADHKSEIAGATKGAVKVVRAAVKVVGGWCCCRRQGSLEQPAPDKPEHSGNAYVGSN